jgi:membrane protein required for beta-lactamase induction
MGLIVIVVSLILERALGHLQHLRRLDWFPGYREVLFSRAPGSWTFGIGGAILVLAPVVLAALFLQWLLDDLLWGGLELLFSIAVVTYCLGPEAFNQQVDAYLEAREAGEYGKAGRIAEKLAGGPVSDDIHRQAKQVTTAVLYEGNVRIFAVVFWFLLLGPAGALLYRMAAAYARDTDRRLDVSALETPAFESGAAGRVHAVLDWLPARLLSLTFFLTGSFDDAWRGWRRAWQAEQDLTDSSRSIVVSTGCGAMRHEVDDTSAEAASYETYDLQWVRTARALIWRSLVVWLVIIALLTLAGRIN